MNELRILRARAILSQARNQIEQHNPGFIHLNLELAIENAEATIDAHDASAAEYHLGQAEHYWARCPHPLRRAS